MRDERKLARLLRLESLTAEGKIQCTTYLERVPVYGERGVAGADAAWAMPDLHLVHHGTGLATAAPSRRATASR